MSVDWAEFVKNRDGKESADRLLLILSFPFATALALKIGSTESLGVYLAAYGALAANNKWADKNASIPVDSQQLETTNVQPCSGITSGGDMDSEPLARKSKPAGRGKRRAF